VQVRLIGAKQPEATATTDRQGRFSLKVCAGQVDLYVNDQGNFARARTDAGDTNVIMQLQRSGTAIGGLPQRPTLKNKPLPEMTGVGLEASAVATGKPLLLCLFDAEQRPSRRAMQLLAERYAALERQGIAVAGLQAASMEPAEWEEWKEGARLPFPVGRVMEKTPQMQWATGVASLPWLILRNAEGKVIAEGFEWDQLEATLSSVNKP